MAGISFIGSSTMRWLNQNQYQNQNQNQTSKKKSAQTHQRGWAAPFVLVCVDVGVARPIAPHTTHARMHSTRQVFVFYDLILSVAQGSEGFVVVFRRPSFEGRYPEDHSALLHIWKAHIAFPKKQHHETIISYFLPSLRPSISRVYAYVGWLVLEAT